MNQSQLEHLLRAAAHINGERGFVIIGSQAILGQRAEAPEALLGSMEADIHPIFVPEKALQFGGAIGKGSRFAERYRYHVDRIDGALATFIVWLLGLPASECLRHRHVRADTGRRRTVLSTVVVGIKSCGATIGSKSHSQK